MVALAFSPVVFSYIMYGHLAILGAGICCLPLIAASFLWAKSTLMLWLTMLVTLITSIVLLATGLSLLQFWLLTKSITTRTDHREASPRMDPTCWEKLPTETYATTCSQKLLHTMLQNRGLTTTTCTKIENDDKIIDFRQLCHYDDHCSICCEDFQEKDNLRILPCRHAFHKDCFDPWAHSCCVKQRSITCPLCNQSIMAKANE